MKKPLLCMTAAVSLLALTSAAQAHSTYDGPWNLLFVTQRGACDPTYNFSVNITDGIVTHPNLVKFRGYVSRSGATRASVTVHDKYAPGRDAFQGCLARALGAVAVEIRAALDTGPRKGTKFKVPGRSTDSLISPKFNVARNACSDTETSRPQSISTAGWRPRGPTRNLARSFASRSSCG